MAKYHLKLTIILSFGILQCILAAKKEEIFGYEDEVYGMEYSWNGRGW